MKARTTKKGLCLFTLLIFPVCALFCADLLIEPADMRLELEFAPDGAANITGYRLYIRKKPDILSVMLTESTENPYSGPVDYANRSPEWSEWNNGIWTRYNIIDSTPERDAQFGEAFHLYIPGRMGYAYPSVKNGMFISIRSFASRYGDDTNGFKDNPFTVNFSAMRRTPVPASGPYRPSVLALASGLYRSFVPVFTPSSAPAPIPASGPYRPSVLASASGLYRSSVPAFTPTPALTPPVPWPVWAPAMPEFRQPVPVSTPASTPATPATPAVVPPVSRPAWAPAVLESRRPWQVSAPEPPTANPAVRARKAPSGFFITGGLQYYILSNNPDVILKSSLPGLRLGAGWELPLGPGAFALGVETGWTDAGLWDPSRPAASATLFPLSFKGGYGLLLTRAFSLRLDALAGGLFTMDGSELAFSPLFGGRFSGEWTFTFSPEGRPLLGLYVGGGADFIPQINGLVTLPVVEVGLRGRFGNGK